MEKHRQHALLVDILVDKTREMDSLHRAALGPLSLIDHVVMRPLADILHVYR